MAVRISHKNQCSKAWVNEWGSPAAAVEGYDSCASPRI